MELDRRARAVLPAAALVLPPLAVVAPLGTAPLLALAAVVLYALDGRRCRDGLRALSVLGALLAALGLWATASAFWSILPGHSLFEGLRLLATSAGGLIVVAAAATAAPDERRHIGTALTLGVTIAFVLLLVERIAHTPLPDFWLPLSADQHAAITRFDRGITVLVLALWPTIFALTPGWRRVVLALAVIALAVILSSAAAMLAALVAIAIYGVACFAPRLAAAAMIAGILALAAAIPLATPSYDTVVALHQNAPWLKPSGIHRLLIWRFGADRVAERPLFGWGMDASRAIPGGKTDLNEMLPALHYGDRIEAMPLHPHDAALEWQLELGLPGLVLGLAVVTWVLWHFGWRAPLAPERRAGALALSGAALTVGMLSFGIWQSWWLATLWLVVACYVAMAREGG